MMDRRGEGVPVIFAATQELTGMAPIYRLLDEAELCVSIPAVPIEDKAKLRQQIEQKLVSEREKLVFGDKKLVFEGEKLVFEGEKLVSGDKKLVSGDKKLVSGDKKLVSGEKLSVPTKKRIADLRARLGGNVFGLTELTALMPRSTAIRLMSKMKALKIILPAAIRGKYRFDSGLL